jgi:hypothetical protein
MGRTDRRLPLICQLHHRTLTVLRRWRRSNIKAIQTRRPRPTRGVERIPAGGKGEVLVCSVCRYSCLNGELSSDRAELQDVEVDGGECSCRQGVRRGFQDRQGDLPHRMGITSLAFEVKSCCESILGGGLPTCKVKME